MKEFIVTGTRTKGDEQKQFTAPVVAESEDDAVEQFKDSVEDEGEFNMVGVQ